MSYLDWHVGMKVVCVDDGGFISTEYIEIMPVVGSVYTIREIVPYGKRVGLRLDEIRNGKFQYTQGIQEEAAFSAKNFRPVHTRKTDVSIFTAMLTGSKRRVSA